MKRHVSKRQCKHCKVFFTPAPRNVGRQHYCAQPPCRQASKAASQQRWLRKPENHDYFRGSTHVARVRQWRQRHPGYGRRQAAPAAAVPVALQDPLSPQPLETQPVAEPLRPSALQDHFFLQPAVFVGLLAHLTGLTFQEDIATTARRLQQLGGDILASAPSYSGGMPEAQTSPLTGTTPPRAQPVQLGGSALGP